MSDNEREGPAATPRKKPSGLGRGLNALFGDVAAEAPVLASPGAARPATTAPAGDSVQHIAVGA
ncbi:MAG: ParB/RepB/Spo0J family partition protein, partial [Sphingopyxis sp.]